MKGSTKLWLSILITGYLWITYFTFSDPDPSLRGIWAFLTIIWVMADLLHTINEEVPLYSPFTWIKSTVLAINKLADKYL